MTSFPQFPLLRWSLAATTTLLLIFVSSTPRVEAISLYGCGLSGGLCEENEVCFEDGLFGQCYSPAGSLPPPTVVDDLDDVQLELLRLELTRLANQDQDWADARAQCVLAYYKLSVAYDLKYDPDFCQARNPSNIWALVQLVELGLKEDPAVVDELADAVEEPIPVLVAEVPEGLQEVEALPAEELEAEQLAELLDEINEPAPVIGEEAMAVLPLPLLSEDDSSIVSSYLEEILNNGNPDLSQLSDDQLNGLIASILALKDGYEVVPDAVEATALEGVPAKEETKGSETSAVAPGEVEDEVAVDEASQQTVLKKDAEKIGDVRTGLDPTKHKIVKGRRSVSKVVGNRVYLKVSIKSQEQLLPLLEFLQHTIALPNNLIFDEPQFDDKTGQLSLRISRLPIAPEDEVTDEAGTPKDKRIDSVEGVAQAVYKRRQDIQQYAGAEVSETGIGIGDDSVPVASNDQDWLFMPLLFVSVFTITSLTTVLAVHVYKRRRGNYGANIRQLADAVDGKSDLVYQELCRQRMSDAGVVGSKTSSTSSWVEDEKNAIDISTGHVLLNFLQTSLSDPTRIDSQWENIKDYCDKTKSTSTAESNASGNRAVLPYDETLVRMHSSPEASTSLEEYLNASFIFDDDPRQAAFIAAQSPLVTQFAAFWRAVWQQGVTLIVNLSTLEESRAEGAAYWPEKGSECHGEFEIHLVSEHIWSDDYLVRSFYLKNLKDGQTRTITQFHFVGWKANEAPASPKTLLEFRRKVNKSYRGRSSPLLVHSTEGAGRTGVYCAVDIICQRIQRGVKEMDVAASLEHLRDQRPRLVKTGEQYKFIYACVAQEVSALLKGLQQ